MNFSHKSQSPGTNSKNIDQQSSTNGTPGVNAPSNRSISPPINSKAFRKPAGTHRDSNGGRYPTLKTEQTMTTFSKGSISSKGRANSIESNEGIIDIRTSSSGAGNIVSTSGFRTGR